MTNAADSTPGAPASRELASDSKRTTKAIRSKALVLYEGSQTPHRSCGIALAETFGRPTAAYQSLRRGGITGQGTCGAVVAGQLLLGELLGDPSPTGAVTFELREAMKAYLARVGAEVHRGAATTWICNDLTAQWGEFQGPTRHGFCTSLVGVVAGIVADICGQYGISIQVEPTLLASGGVLDHYEKEST